MLYFIIFTYMFLLPTTIIAFLWKILDTLEKAIEKPKESSNDEEIKPKRKHLSIGQSNFENAFGGRKAYSIYKNTNGLYEPITPSKGINLKKKKEE